MTYGTDALPSKLFSLLLFLVDILQLFDGSLELWGNFFKKTMYN